MNEVNRGSSEQRLLNLFYYKIGLEATKLGDEFGWYSDTGHLAELKLTSRLTEDDIRVWLSTLQRCLPFEAELY